jgi:anthranilate synthase/aminodeoxychorismate synthase-like glutamine amidotransferase
VILIVDNYDSFTWNLVQRFGELDPSIRLGEDLLVLRNDEVTAQSARKLAGGCGPSHIVVSPGPCTPAEAGNSSAIIQAFAGRVPVLGVCLGHQCIGDVFGMSVVRHAVPVHGKTAEVEHDGVGIFEGVPSPFTAARYHSLVIKPDSVPALKPGEEGWAVSALARETDERGGERTVVMGLRRVWADDDKAPLIGVQFHPESFLTEEGPRLLANFLAMGRVEFRR